MASLNTYRLIFRYHFHIVFFFLYFINILPKHSHLTWPYLLFAWSILHLFIYFWKQTATWSSVAPWTAIYLIKFSLCNVFTIYLEFCLSFSHIFFTSKSKLNRFIWCAFLSTDTLSNCSKTKEKKWTKFLCKGSRTQSTISISLSLSRSVCSEIFLFFFWSFSFYMTSRIQHCSTFYFFFNVHNIHVLSACWHWYWWCIFFHRYF